MIDQRRIYEFSGTHYEMGLQQGMIFRNKSQELLNIFKGLDQVKEIKPRGLPTNLFIKIASKRAYNELGSIFKRYTPNQAERIKGLAEGSGIDERIMYLLSGAELLFGGADWELPHLRTGCTSIAYSSKKTENGHTMISRNFDYAKFIVPFLMLRRNIPNGFNRTFDLTAFILPGTFNGMNETGVYIATDEAFPLKEKDKGLPASLIIQEALEKCNSTKEVIDYFKKVPRGSGNVVLIADNQDDLKILEYTSERVYVREPYEGDEFIVGTNHYTFEDLKLIDLPREAVFGKKTPKSLWGACINETSYVRKDTAERLIRIKSKINVEWLKNLHRDHSADPQKKGGMETICHHDPENISAASMIVDLNNFDAWICYGLPCENEYFKINFK